MKTLPYVGRTLARRWCNGSFSKNYDLQDALIEAKGPDWVVVRTREGVAYWQSFAGCTKKEIRALLEEWCTPDPSDE